MKAIAYEKYGSADVLELKEVRKPEIEGDRVLVRILAASANPYDWHFMRGVPYIARPAAMGVRKPNTHFSAATWRGRSRRSATR